MTAEFPLAQFPRPDQPEAPKPVKQRHRWPWVVGIMTAFALGAGTGAAGHAADGTTLATQPAPAIRTVTLAPTTATVTPPPVTQTVTSVPAPQTVAAAPEPPAAPTGPATSFGNGQYQAGVDIVPGHYKSSGPSDGSMCYVEIAKNDLGTLDSIISNDIVKGPKSVTVSKGQYVKNDGCSTFTKTS